MKSLTKGASILAAIVLAASISQAGLTVTVVPSSAPNAYSSPGWAGYVGNALYSLENGLGSTGDRTSNSTAYETVGPITHPRDAVVTSFASWMGVAFPSAPFAAEHGNRLHFGLHIVGDGSTRFRLNDLTFNLTSSDGILDFAGDFNGYGYSSTRYGIDWGADGAKGGGDDIVYASGNGLTLVDELVYVGVGNAYWPTADEGYSQDQQGINDIFQYVGSMGSIDVQTTYTMYDSSGAGILGSGSGGTTLMIPAPGAALLGAIGLGTVAWIRRRI